MARGGALHRMMYSIASDGLTREITPGILIRSILVSRMLETRGTCQSDTIAKMDTDRNEQVILEIGPHADLSERQQKVIAPGYGMRGCRANISVRRALLYCALKWLGLDTDPAARRAQDQYTVLLNTSELRECSEPASAVPAMDG
jgi:hypothetical protein